MLLSFVWRGMDMVFRKQELNDTGDIVVYSNYHKYWLDRERKIKNPLFVHAGQDCEDGSV